MILRAERFTIPLRRPFRIAHGSSDTRETILVHLTADGLQGHGEGALPPYYPSQAVACLEWLANVQVSTLPPDGDATSIPQAPPTAAAARTALQIALRDLWGQRSGKPLWQAWDLNPLHIPRCARTISIPADEKELGEMIEEGRAAGSRYFKLKSGSGDLEWDEKCVRLVLAGNPDLRLSVDANAGWSPAEAARIIPRLAVDYVEQPVGIEPGQWAELRRLLGTTPIPPLIADESVQSEKDLAALRGLADGVNVKLLKAGGLDGARRWITQARAAGLKVLIGVMVETGIGRTAAAQLAPLADWLDIDPPDAIPVEPLSGFRVEGDHLFLSDRPGLGLTAPVREGGRLLPP